MLSRIVAPLALFAALLLLWEAYCRLSGVSGLILPPPSGIAAALYFERGEILRHARATAQVALLGFSLSVAFALASSLALHFYRGVEAAVLPLMAASQTIPIVALAPLMILWFGFGLLPKVLLVILVTFFPMLLSLLAGYRQVPGAFVDLLCSMGAGPWLIFRRATFPAALPNFMAGLRISATYAVVAAIFAEYAGARQGLGIYILAAKNSFRADLVLAAVVSSALLTLALLALLSGLARLHPQTRRSRHGA